MSYPFATATATILRAIKAGKVSGTKDGSGQIETAELHGIYPRNGADTDAAVELGMAAPPLVPVERMPAHAELRLRVALAEERLSETKAALDDMRRDRDAWRDQAQASQRPFTDHGDRRPWWKRRLAVNSREKRGERDYGVASVS
jgi:hypothetical protein